jgi:sugar phosphate isomerase/epimerase
VTPKRSFGVSTRLYHGQRLCREHLLEIAASGFESVELFATRTHFDYHSPAAVADLQSWLADAGLELHGIHAPVSDSFVGGRWGAPITLASADAGERARAVDEAERALHVARRIPVTVLVAHLGLPRSQGWSPADNSRDGARRSVEALQRLAAPLDVRVAVEVGVCLDFGHAHMDGDLIDAIETVSGHLMTTHVHDNTGRADDHLVPFDGTIDWPAAMTAIQKVGYDQTLMFEIGARGPAKETLRKAQRARQRIERLLAE